MLSAPPAAKIRKHDALQRRAMKGERQREVKHNVDTQSSISTIVGQAAFVGKRKWEHSSAQTFCGS